MARFPTPPASESVPRTGYGRYAVVLPDGQESAFEAGLKGSPITYSQQLHMDATPYMVGRILAGFQPLDLKTLRYTRTAFLGPKTGAIRQTVYRTGPGDSAEHKFIPFGIDGNPTIDSVGTLDGISTAEALADWARKTPSISVDNEYSQHGIHALVFTVADRNAYNSLCRAANAVLAESAYGRITGAPSEYPGEVTFTFAGEDSVGVEGFGENLLPRQGFRNGSEKIGFSQGGSYEEPYEMDNAVMVGSLSDFDPAFVAALSDFDPVFSGAIWEDEGPWDSAQWDEDPRVAGFYPPAGSATVGSLDDASATVDADDVISLLRAQGISATPSSLNKTALYRQYGTFALNADLDADGFAVVNNLSDVLSPVTIQITPKGGTTFGEAGGYLLVFHTGHADRGVEGFGQNLLPRPGFMRGSKRIGLGMSGTTDWAVPYDMDGNPSYSGGFAYPGIGGLVTNEGVVGALGSPGARLPHGGFMQGSVNVGLGMTGTHNWATPYNMDEVTMVGGFAYPGIGGLGEAESTVAGFAYPGIGGIEDLEYMGSEDVGVARKHRRIAHQEALEAENRAREARAQARRAAASARKDRRMSDSGEDRLQTERAAYQQELIRTHGENLITAEGRVGLEEALAARGSVEGDGAPEVAGLAVDPMAIARANNALGTWAARKGYGDPKNRVLAVIGDGATVAQQGWKKAITDLTASQTTKASQPGRGRFYVAKSVSARQRIMEEARRVAPKGVYFRLDKASNKALADAGYYMGTFSVDPSEVIVGTLWLPTCCRGRGAQAGVGDLWLAPLGQRSGAVKTTKVGDLWLAPLGQGHSLGGKQEAHQVVGDLWLAPLGQGHFLGKDGKKKADRVHRSSESKSGALWLPIPRGTYARSGSLWLNPQESMRFDLSSGLMDRLKLSPAEVQQKLLGRIQKMLDTVQELREKLSGVKAEAQAVLIQDAENPALGGEGDADEAAGFSNAIYASKCSGFAYPGVGLIEVGAFHDWAGGIFGKTGFFSKVFTPKKYAEALEEDGSPETAAKAAAIEAAGFAYPGAGSVSEAHIEGINGEGPSYVSAISTRVMPSRSIYPTSTAPTSTYGRSRYAYQGQQAQGGAYGQGGSYGQQGSYGRQSYGQGQGQFGQQGQQPIVVPQQTQQAGYQPPQYTDQFGNPMMMDTYGQLIPAMYDPRGILVPAV